MASQWIKGGEKQTEDGNINNLCLLSNTENDHTFALGQSHCKYKLYYASPILQYTKKVIDGLKFNGNRRY